jgi:hypothetical protein
MAADKVNFAKKPAKKKAGKGKKAKRQRATEFNFGANVKKRSGGKGGGS